MAKKGEKILTRKRVDKLGLDKVSVITADMLDGFTSIGDNAFYNCTGLTSIEIPNSVTNIGWDAFYRCSGLTSIEIPNSVTSIGGSAFSNCISLTSVTIPNSVTIIRDWAFSDCSGLTSIEIPNSVTSIGNNAFRSCSGLTSIDVSDDNPNYSSKDGVLFNKQQLTLIQCPGDKQGAYVIPNSVTSIGDYAFSDCRGLRSIEIPNSVTSIGWSAFKGCSGLTSIEIPNSVTIIGWDAFSNCSSLTSVTIPNSVTSIGNGAFWICSSLTSVIVGDKVYKKQTITNGKCKAYKAFNADMTCRGFQYKEGETYELDGEPILCEHGFHACLNLTDVFTYYQGKLGKDVVVNEVELEGVSIKMNEDSKVVAKKITIGKRIL